MSTISIPALLHTTDDELQAKHGDPCSMCPVITAESSPTTAIEMDLVEEIMPWDLEELVRSSRCPGQSHAKWLADHQDEVTIPGDTSILFLGTVLVNDVIRSVPCLSKDRWDGRWHTGGRAVTDDVAHSACFSGCRIAVVRD